MSATKTVKTAGTAEASNSYQPLSALLTPQVYTRLEMQNELTSAMENIDLLPVIVAVLNVIRMNGWRIHQTVPVCTHCRAEVDAIAWEAIARLDGEHTETVARMIAQNKIQQTDIKADFEARGLKV